MEGLKIFKLYLKYFNYIYINKDKGYNIKNVNNLDSNKDELRYCEYHGEISLEDRTNNKDIFNLSDNKYGKYCKIIMISGAGAEGINLSNVRQVHIIEPYWNEVRIEQVIGRALRFCQHKDLPMNERIVDIYRYTMFRNNKKKTSDEKLEELSRKKNNLLLSFIESVKEVAVDCDIFKNHNMMGSKYKCFQFNEDSLFDKNIGEAYQLNIDNDFKLNNGLNATDSSIVRIKVRKIKAVKRMGDNILSNETYYWLNDNTNIVYDYDLLYPIGKLSLDNYNNYNLIENNIYIIDELINIPKIKLYD